MKRRTFGLAAGVLAAVRLLAQAPPAFEVASIRVHSSQSGDRGGPQVAGNRVALTGNLNQLVMYAYDLKSYQISGGPGWVTHPSTDSDYYDISAKAEGTKVLTRARARLLLQTLLTDRFRLRLRRETKEVPVYALVVDRGGPKFKESVSDAACRQAGSVSPTTITSTLTKCPMDALVRLISGAADRPVLEQTGLPGVYDFKLEFARDPAAADNMAWIDVLDPAQIRVDNLAGRDGPVCESPDNLRGAPRYRHIGSCR